MGISRTNIRRMNALVDFGVVAVDGVENRTRWSMWRRRRGGAAVRTVRSALRHCGMRRGVWAWTGPRVGRSGDGRLSLWRSGGRSLRMLTIPWWDRRRCVRRVWTRSGSSRVWRHDEGLSRMFRQIWDALRSKVVQIGRRRCLSRRRRGVKWVLWVGFNTGVRRAILIQRHIGHPSVERGRGRHPRILLFFFRTVFL